MKNYIVYDNKGKILRTGSCSNTSFALKAGDGELIIEGVADDVTQKIIDGKVVNKTSEEMAAENPPSIEIPFGQRKAMITNEQYRYILDRLTELERNKEG